MDFKELTTVQNYNDFFLDPRRANHHTFYYHYTRLGSVDNIFKENAFRLRNLAESSNDEGEKQHSAGEGEVLFSVCFATGTSENLPMWYLYSGADGKGGRLGLRKSDFIVLRNAKVSLAEVENSPSHPLLESPVPLGKDEYEITAHDVLYIGRDTANKGNLYRAKYCGDTNNKILEKTYQGIMQEGHLLTKGLIWFYEKETRIEVKVPKKMLKKPNGNYVVLLDLSDVIDRLSLRVAPEFSEPTEEVIGRYPNIKAWLATKIEKSDFAGEINMNLTGKLCDDCPNKNRSGESSHADSNKNQREESK
ncbi:MAG: hypothetical protein SOX74_04765 [Candidatus Faecousia sp.]|uniref:hypothetical protein n=1 Tax=Faecousia sp. TaxID=2952921 RepID=UPI002A87DF34|nr:hypothetical protein [Candidatus Faecousia sp.]